jgi:hypothetical protein
MLIHRQNSYASRSRPSTSRREAQSREPVNKVKNLSVHGFAPQKTETFMF